MNSIYVLPKVPSCSYGDLEIRPVLEVGVKERQVVLISPGRHQGDLENVLFIAL